MNIINAIKAAHERGFTVIALDYPGGFELIRTTNGGTHTKRAKYPDGATGSAIFHNYSLNLNELLSDGWYVTDALCTENTVTATLPATIDPDITTMHGYMIGEVIEVVPTGDRAVIGGFNLNTTPFDIVVRFSDERESAYISAEDIRHLPVSHYPAPPASAHLPKSEADKLVALAHGMKLGFMEPYTSESFHRTVCAATDIELSTAFAYLVDKLDHGEKVKRRIQAVQSEQRRRQKKNREGLNVNG